MTIAEVTLTDSENEALHVLSQRTGKTRDAILREAVELLLDRNRSELRLVLLREARGIWQDLETVPCPAIMRSEWYRAE